MNKQKSEGKTKRFSLKKIIIALICGLVLSLGLTILLIYIYNPIAGWMFWIGLITFVYWFYRTENIRKIIGRTFVGLSIESFALPIAMVIFTIVFVSTETENSLEALGATIGGGIVVLIAGFLGFFLGIIFLILGYFTLKK